MSQKRIIIPGSHPAAVVTPGDHGLQRQDARDVDVHHLRLWETRREHRVEADDVEQVEPVVRRYLVNIGQILGIIECINNRYHFLHF